MTHKEAIKNLTELQLRLINDNSEEATEYNKKIYDTLAYFITQTIPLSVIEDIKAEIEKAYKHQRIVQGTKWTNGLLCAVEIIDRKIKEIKHESI